MDNRIQYHHRFKISVGFFLALFLFSIYSPGVQADADTDSSCGGFGQALCQDSMCDTGYHPKGICVLDFTIAEPDCNCTAEELPANDINSPVYGYADLHLHMFSNLAFGGMTLWGDAFNKEDVVIGPITLEGGVSQALKSDHYAQRTADYILNGHVKSGINGEIVPIDLFRGQQLVHGDGHFNDIVGGGTNQHVALGVGFFSLANSGVDWEGNTDTQHFLGWPRWNSTTHQQSYFKWLERAHRGGLQLTVMLAVNNEAMCISGRYLDYDEFNCAETMRAIDLQLDKAAELQDWLDAECKGGDLSACATGSSTDGWFKIVKTPLQAREAIANGQLAVVLGIEEANLFDCNDGECTEEYVQEQLDIYYNKGVRHIFPIHNFDNDYGGAATWMDTIAVGNKYSVDEWYEAENCPDTSASIAEENGEIENGYGFKLEPAVTDWLAAKVLGEDDWDLPGNWPGLTTSCNVKGLTPLGTKLVKQLMEKGMIIDIDHMSIHAIDDTLDIALDNSYPGIVASHVLMFDLTMKKYRHERMRTLDHLQRIADLGGMIGAMTQPPEGAGAGPGHPVSILQSSGSAIDNDCQTSSKTWAQMYEWAVDAMGGAAVAFGSDFNGISRHNSPRFGEDACDGQLAANLKQDDRMDYPFSIDSFGEFEIQQTGNRVFDYNEVGLAHVGLLPDMIQDLKKVGLTDDDLKPLFQSAEAYIVMWEGSEQAAEVLNDNTAPVASVTLLPAANVNGWNNSPVTATITAVDEIDGSGVEFISYKIAPELTLTQIAGSSHVIDFDTEGEYQLDYGAIDQAGNNSEILSITINLDLTDPEISTSITPLANAAGWHNSDVTVVFNCTDSLSGVASCSEDALLSEGENQSVTGYVDDYADNSSSITVNGINVDTTAPVVSVVGIDDGASFILGNTLPVISCHAVDDLSGLDGESVLTISGGSETFGSVGEFIASCSGVMDVAGNIGQSASIAYSVRFSFSGFQNPVDSSGGSNAVNAGRTIPIRFSIDGNYGLSIVDGQPTTSSISCDFTGDESDIKSAKATNKKPVSHDESSGTYKFQWKTDKAWKNSCRLFRIKLVDGATHTAGFDFSKNKFVNMQPSVVVTSSANVPPVNELPADENSGLTPESFSYSGQIDVSLSAEVISDSITVRGINGPVLISVIGGAISINGGAFTSDATTVSNGDTVRVQHVSSADNNTVTDTVVSIGTVTATFSSTTADRDTETDSAATTDSNDESSGAGSIDLLFLLLMSLLVLPGFKGVTRYLVR